MAMRKENKMKTGNIQMNKKNKKSSHRYDQGNKQDPEKTKNAKEAYTC